MLQKFKFCISGRPISATRQNSRPQSGRPQSGKPQRPQSGRPQSGRPRSAKISDTDSTIKSALKKVLFKNGKHQYCFIQWFIFLLASSYFATLTSVFARVSERRTRIVFSFLVDNRIVCQTWVFFHFFENHPIKIFVDIFIGWNIKKWTG